MRPMPLAMIKSRNAQPVMLYLTVLHMAHQNKGCAGSSAALKTVAYRFVTLLARDKGTLVRFLKDLTGGTKAL